MPSSHLILRRPLLLLPSIPPSIRVFSNESTLHMRWPKYWSLSFSTIPSKEIPGLISFRMDWLDLLAVQGTLKSLQGTINAMCLNQPKTMPPPNPQSMEKIVFHETGLWCQKGWGLLFSRKDKCDSSWAYEIENCYNFWVSQKVTNIPTQILSSLGFALFFFFFPIHLAGFLRWPLPRAPLALAYKYLGFIMPLAPRCLEVSVALTWTLWSWDWAAISRFLTY